MATLDTDNIHATAITSKALHNVNVGEPVGQPKLNQKMEWPTAFAKVHGTAVMKYKEGVRRAENLFTSDEVAFLESIGCTSQELYDFIEDWCDLGEPSFDVVGRITAVRRQYFLSEQKSQPSSKLISPSSFPSKEAELGDFVWLPRIIAKGRAKLRGELPPEIMYGCGADRSFLRSVGIDPAEFLGVIWNAGDDDHKILEYVALKPLSK